ncbi:hypothetical protein [Spartinivicinus poritis]|uniref:Uncharacterized protein n=1 Tax=Spartinivicinus poritis TaxID=2994640 RepID=A0ABT5UHA4_9GAMM|nr:hypothetical protein [Spartinivicinus sp. A2-2]MDE1465772.1 hypothetical protein [Spartinivicinus sp. A2-2]
MSIDGFTESYIEAGFGLPFIRQLRALEYCSVKEFSGDIKIPDYFKVESICGYTSYEELAAVGNTFCLISLHTSLILHLKQSQ